ncbi:MAG: class I SAM-dependent methyltransferase [Ornithinimicrobium sp.]
MSQASFSAIFTHALQGNPVQVVGVEDDPYDLPVDDWTGHADPIDHRLLDECHGATLDIGCGPGRLTLALQMREQVVLGIDIVPEAIDQARSRGATVQARDVFGPLPHEGRWDTALLADGNVGIGGDPVALLSRARDLVGPGGRVVVEVREPGVALKILWATLESGQSASKPFRWAVVGMDDIDDLAGQAGLAVLTRQQVDRRWVVTLGRTP